MPGLAPANKPDRLIVLGTGNASSIALLAGVVTATDEVGGKMKFNYQDVEPGSAAVSVAKTAATRVVDVQATSVSAPTTSRVSTVNVWRFEGRDAYPYDRDYSVYNTAAVTATALVLQMVAEINKDKQRIVNASVGATGTQLRLTSIKTGLGFTVTVGNDFTTQIIITEAQKDFLTLDHLRNAAPDLKESYLAAGKSYKIISLVVNDSIPASNFGQIGGRNGLQGSFVKQPSLVWLLFDLTGTETLSDFDEAVLIFTGAKALALYQARMASATPNNA